VTRYEAFLDGVVEDSLKFSEIPEVIVSTKPWALILRTASMSPEP